jgi:hypothetical protein
LAVLFLFLSAMLTQDAEPYRQTLISAARNVHVADWQLSPRDVDFKSPPGWSIKKFTLRGGRQEGVELILVNNGKLSFTVIPTRGMGVLRVEMGDLRLGWDSPVREVVHPQYMNLESRGGLGWLEGFNEWLVRCGLEFAGHPGPDKFVTNTGAVSEMQLTLHGKIANIPASEVEVVIDRTPPHRIRVRGRVDERMFYGPKLELWTEISTEIGSTSVRIEDEVRNRGALDQEMQLIYHVNYGAPILGKGTRFIGAVKEVRPFNAHAAKDLDRFRDYEGPTKGYVEQVYAILPYSDEAKKTTVMLQNAAGDRGVTMTYSLDQLPYLTLWKNTTAVEEGYVTGLEPGTGFPANRSTERQAGRVPVLKANEARKFTIDVGLLDSLEEVAKATADVEKISAGRAMTVNPQTLMQ